MPTAEGKRKPQAESLRLLSHNVTTLPGERLCEQVCGDMPVVFFFLFAEMECET